MTIDTPHIAFPLRFEDGLAVVVEQDSATHKRDRIRVVCSTPLGSRLDDPKFGIPDQLQRAPAADIGALAAAIEESEPDIDVTITEPGDEGHEHPDAIRLEQDIHLHVESEG